MVLTFLLVVMFMVLNDCYRIGRRMTPKGIILHSTASPGVMAAAWFNRWNKPGIEKCVHGFLDDTSIYQYLPWEIQGWHAGGSANATYIGIELCEPLVDTEEYFKAVWDHAVEVFAKLCHIYNIAPNNILGHCEAHKLGIASNHADPMHWFPKHGKTMDDFRYAVAMYIDMAYPEAAPLYRVQVGAYGVKSNATRMLATLVSKGYADAFIKYTLPYYRVQVGAFRNKDYAMACLEKLKADGFPTYLKTEVR